MTNKKPSSIPRWMLTPFEVIAIVGVIAIAGSGLFLSVRDALQLQQALNLNLTQTLIVSQGLVSMDRDVHLTHKEVLRLINEPDNRLKQISRFDFVEIQINNLAAEVELPSIRYIFADEDIALVQEIVIKSASIKQIIINYEQAPTTYQKTIVLYALDAQLGTLELSVKKLIDRQATAQREAIIETRDSMAISQRTSILAGGVLLLLSVALALVFRRTLTLRLQQAVEADRLKSRLLANVSHEFRTPINAIQGYSQLLSEGSYGGLSDKQQTTIRRILINTTQLKGMVNNLLDRAQIEQGKLTLRNEPFAPIELIETTHSALDILAITKNLELTSEIALDVPAALNGDMLRLQQILFNLVSNAIKFTEDGSVRMRVFLPDKEHWALQVTDTGIGIPLEAQTQIFASFWQIDSSATREYRGSGLGLSIVKQLTDLMGGEVALTSQPEQGSTFTVIFPMETQ